MVEDRNNDVSPHGWKTKLMSWMGSQFHSWSVAKSLDHVNTSDGRHRSRQSDCGRCRVCQCSGTLPECCHAPSTPQFWPATAKWERGYSLWRVGHLHRRTAPANRQCMFVWLRFWTHIATSEHRCEIYSGCYQPWPKRGTALSFT